jgi:hypothetical protein
MERAMPLLGLMSDVVNSSERKQKVVVLRELHRACQHIHYIYLQATIAGRSAFLLSNRAIIYTTKMSKQIKKSHVRDAVHMYLVN